MSKNGIGRGVERPGKPGISEFEETVSTPDFQERFPTLFRFLAEIRETPHWQKTGCVTLFWEDGVYKLVLNDRPACCSCFVSNARLGDLFAIADRGLRSGSLQWRTKGYKPSAQRLLNI